MANTINNSDINAWVDDRMARLSSTPAFQPSPDRVWETLRHRVHQPARHRWGILRWAVIMVILAFVLPVGLTLAQRLFSDPFEFQNSPPVNMEERIRLAQAVLPWTFTSSGPGRSVASLDDAAPLTLLNADGRRVERPVKGMPLRNMYQMFRRDPFGFFGKTRWLPSIHRMFGQSVWMQEKFANPTTILVTEPATFQLKIRAGLSDVQVPGSWDGAVINVRFPPAVIADYGGVVIAQSVPYTATISPPMEMKQFGEFLMGVLGYPERMAKALNDWTFLTNHVDSAVASPASLALYPAEGPYTVKNVLMGPSKGVFGLLVQNTSDKPATCQFCPGPGDLILVWMTDKRMYAIKGPISEDQAVALAYSLM